MSISAKAVSIDTQRLTRVLTRLRSYDVVQDELDSREISDGSAIAQCPCHPGDGYHLRIRPGVARRVALSCDKGCTLHEIVLAAGLLESDVVATHLEPPDSEPLVFERTSAELTPRPRFLLLSDRDLDEMPAIEPLVDNVLPMNSLAAVYGPPGAGKSFVALDVACSVAAGVDWLGRGTTQGAVIYLAAEGSAGLRQRVAAWKQHHRMTGLSLPIYFVTVAANLLTPSDPAALLLAIDTLPVIPILIVIDTVHRSMPGGDENSSRDMGFVIDAADRLRQATGACVLLVHHTAKGSDVERGSGSLRGAVDALLFLKVDDARREIRCEKAKDWAPFEPIPFELAPTGDSCAVVSPGAISTPSGITAQMRQAITSLSRDFLEEGASFSAWRAASGVPEGSFARVRTALVTGGYVTEPPKKGAKLYRITERGAIAVGINYQRGISKVSRTQDPEVSQVSHPFRGDTCDTDPRLSLAREVEV